MQFKYSAFYLINIRIKVNRSLNKNTNIKIVILKIVS